MADFVRSCAVKNIADETMAVRAHRDKIDIVCLRKFDDLIRWFPKREYGVAGETFIAELALPFFQIHAVLFHFFTLSELKLIEISRNPAISDMDEEQPRAGHARQRFDVTKNCFISGTVFEWDKDVSIHF